MDILRNESPFDGKKSEGIWADILATFQSAYALTSTLETCMCANTTLYKDNFFPFLNFKNLLCKYK